MKEFSAFCRHHETMRQVLGNFYSERSGSTTVEEDSPSAGMALSRLTGPTYGFRDIIRSGKATSEKKVEEGPIKKEHLTKMLEYLFPDSNPDGTTAVAYPEEFTSLDNKLDGDEGEDGLLSQLQMQLSSLKTCPVDGFLWRLSVVVSHCLHVLGGIKPVSHLLHEVMLEVRYRFETGYRVPGVPDGPPDHAHCLLHQKLQLLNCCIQRKRAREEGSISAERDGDDDDGNENKSKNESKQSASSDTDEDEFFDCEEEGSGEVKSKVKKQQQDIPIWQSDAEGREKKFGNLMLLEHDAPLYVPVCQEPAPMTEDQLAEQAEVMLQLGMDAEGSELRYNSYTLWIVAQVLLQTEPLITLI